MRRAFVVLLALAGAVIAPAGASAFPEQTFSNQCQYSYDRYWRPVPIIFGGKLVNGSGTELASGARLPVGSTVRLENGTVTALLPSWMTTFAYESEMIPLGDGSLPVRAWLALEATNTAEGVLPPVLLDTVADTHVVLNDKGIVDEERSWITVRNAPVPTQSWTATGGEVNVRQALGESLPPLPVGRDGANVRVRGSLYVEATLTFPSGDVLRLYLDCLQGDQVNQGASHTDALPGALSVFGVPGWNGSVDGVAVPGAVDAELLNGSNPVRAGAGERAVVRDTVLRLRLTPQQRDAWFAGSTSALIAGPVQLFGGAEGAQTVNVSQTVSVADSITVALPDTTWTPSGAEGLSVRGPSTLTLDATAGGVTRRLALTRITAGDPYPFARVLRPAAPPTALPTPTVTATPTPTPTATATPVVKAPPPVPAPRLTVRSSKLKLSGSRVSVSLACADATCQGTLSLKAGSRVLAKSAKYSLAAGKRANVRLTLSSAGRKYLRSRKKVTTRLTVKPSSGTAVSKRLTLSR